MKTTNYNQRQSPQLHIAHQSQLIKLRQEITELKSTIKALTQQLNHQPTSGEVKKKIFLPIIDGYELVDVNRIMYCNADKSYTTFFVQPAIYHSKTKQNPKVYVVSKTLKAVEEWLDCKNMCRCHQSFLVNLNYVVGHANDSLMLANNISINISRRNRKIVFARLAAVN